MNTISKKSPVRSVKVIGLSTVAAMLLLASPTFSAEANPVGSGSVAMKADAATPPPSGGPGDRTTARASSGSEIMIGDKLQVSFFEQLDLGRPGDSGMTADARSFYQRLDLTGQHLVAADGTISIPLLGRFVVAGSTPEEVGANIVETYQAVMGRSGQVDISTLERKPVFVTGIVKSAGAFRFEPGMVVLQAIALAGGYDRGAEAAARLIEAQRERERNENAANRLEWLLARRDRLVGLRDSDTGRQPPPDQRSDLLGTDGNAASVEARVLDAELAAISVADNLHEATLATTKQQIDAANSILVHIGNQIDVRSERLRVLQQMQGRGVTSLETLWNAQKEVGDLMMEKERVGAQLALVEHDVVRTEAEGAKRAVDRRLQIERELAAVEEEIAQHSAIVESSQRMAMALETTVSGVPSGQPLSVSILRRTPSSTLMIEADETTDLLPGDVVKVEVVTKSGAVIALTGAAAR